MSTLGDILKYTKETLKNDNVREWESDGLILFEEAYGLDRGSMLTKMKDEAVITPRLTEYINKRLNNIPVQYITGKAYFYGRTYNVNEHVLIPRFDTEVVVYEALREFSGQTVLDMCTGSGCIAITIALMTDAHVSATDISDEALQVAKTNASFNGAQVDFIKSDLFSEIKGTYDMIISNPPYIRSDEIETLDKEVKLMEPRLALDGGDDGLIFYKEIISDSRRFLVKDGLLVFEIGYDQGSDVKALMEAQGFVDVHVKKDLANLDRVVIGKYRK